MTIINLWVGPGIPVWVKLLIVLGLIIAVLVWWKKAYWED